MQSAMQSAMTFISATPMPRVVTAGVPRRTPEAVSYTHLAFNQTYHSLQRSAGALLHHAGVILPTLVGLYAVATNLLFIPCLLYTSPGCRAPVPLP